MKKLVLYKVVSIIILMFFSLFVMSSSEVFQIANCCFYVYFALIFFSVLVLRSFTFDVVWMLGFIFIVLSEMLFMSNSQDGLSVSKYIILANNVILAAYHVSKTKTSFNLKDYEISNKTWAFILLLLITVLFVVVIIPKAVLTLQVGRYTAEQLIKGGLLQTIVFDFGYILPAFWAYYFNYKRYGIVISFLFSLPIFVLLAMCGTRFPMLFSVLGFAFSSNIIHVFEINKKDVRYYVLGAVGLLFVFNGMLNMRVGGTDNMEISYSSNVNQSLSQKVVSYGSSEGVVNANIWLHDYCQKNGYTLGKQSSFIFYWWIPRRIWKNKPVMTGGWLPHLYGNFSEGHSASVGIYGELFVDFGYVSFILFIFYGLLLKRFESYCRFILTKKRDSINVIQASIILPFIFFSVRSPITSFITLSTSFILFYLLRFLVFRKKVE